MQKNEDRPKERAASTQGKTGQQEKDKGWRASFGRREKAVACALPVRLCSGLATTGSAGRDGPKDKGMLQREFNYRGLMVRDESGRYRLATGDEIIEAALSEINRRFARGVAIASLADTMEFLRLRLGPLEHELFAVLWLDNKHRVLSNSRPLIFVT